jgi:hypothetical protein
MGFSIDDNSFPVRTAFCGLFIAPPALAAIYAKSAASRCQQKISKKIIIGGTEAKDFVILIKVRD